jgi:ELWxxDGT repeat protein
LSYPRYLTNVGGTLYFAATDGSGGFGLWKSDGTEAGTVRVKDIRTGTYGSSLTNVGGTLYFTANDGSSGYELWKSDGTDAGTVLVEDLTGDSASANPRSITLVDDRLFVVADSDVFGSELWSGKLGSLQGDFDRNGLLELAEIDALVAAIAGGGNPLPFDLDNDSLVNGQDLHRWLQLGGAANLPSGHAYLPGDANLDGVVDGSDFGIWNAHKFTAVAAWSAGDFNADGQVDGSDFGIWNANKFTASDGSGRRMDGDPLPRRTSDRSTIVSPIHVATTRNSRSPPDDRPGLRTLNVQPAVLTQFETGPTPNGKFLRGAR